MLGLSSGLIKGTSVLRSIVKKGLQAWYKADKTQAPLGEEKVINGNFAVGSELVSNGDFSSGLTGWSNPGYSLGGGFATIEDKGGYARLSNATTDYTLTGVSYEGGSKTVTHDSNANIKVGHYIIGDGLHHSPAGTGGPVADYAYVDSVVSDTEFTIQHAPASGVDVNNGTVKVTTDSRSKYLVSGNVAFENGKTYQIKFKVRGKSASTQLVVRADHTRSNAQIASNLNVTTSFVEHTLYTTVTNTYWDSIGFGMLDWQPTSEPSESDEWIEIDDVSIKETNIEDNWVVYEGSEVATVNYIRDGHALIPNDGLLVQQSTMVNGRKYKLEFDVTDLNVATGHYVRVQDNDDSTNSPYYSITSNGHHSISFTYTTSHPELQFKSSGSATAALSNITLREITNSIKDFSSNTNTGLLYSGKALKFDGDQDEIDIGAIALTGEFTVALWYNVDDPHDSDHAIFGDGNTNDNLSVQGNTTFRLRIDNANIAFYRFNEHVQAGKWARIVLTRDNTSTIRLYRDNTLGTVYDSSNSSPVPHARNTGTFTVSNLGKQGSFEFDGSISDFQVYDKCWTPDDVAYDYNNPDKDVFDDEGRAEVLGSEKISNKDFSELGTELMENGDFANGSIGFDSVQSGWSFSEGKALVDSTGSVYLSQNNFGLEQGHTYILSFEISDYEFGKFQVQSGNQIIPSVNSNGVYNITFTAKYTNQTLLLYAVEISNKVKFSLDNVSVRKVIDWKADLVGTDNSELPGWSISGNKASVDCTQTTPLRQTSFNIVSGKAYRLNFEVSDFVRGGLQVQFGSQIIPSVSSNGVYSYTIIAAETDTVLYLYGLNSTKLSVSNLSVVELPVQAGEIYPTDCKALYRLNEGAGNRLYNAAPVLSAEFVNNNDFSLGNNGNWSSNVDTGDSTIVISEGKATINIVSGVFARIHQTFSLVSGRTYILNATVKGLSGSNGKQVRFQDDVGVTQMGTSDKAVITLDESVQSIETVWVANSNSSGIVVARDSSGDWSFEVHYVSVKEISLSDSYVQTSWASSNWIKAQRYIPQYAMSSYSKKMIFDGSNDYVELATEKTIAAADAFSLSFWYYNIDTSSSQIILGKDGSTDDYLSLGAGDESLIFKAGGNSKTLDFNSDLIAGKLNHIVLTSPGGTGTMKCYLNGILQDDTENSLNADFDYRHIFRNSTDYGEGFIDELAHFNKALSANEVQEIFNAGIALDVRDHSCYYGSEVLTNGDFSSSGVLSSSHQNLGFLEDNGLASISNGELSITATSSLYGSVYATINNSSRNILEAPGVFYKFTYTITEVTGSLNMDFYSQPSGWTNLTAEQMTVGTHTIMLETAGRNFAVRQKTDGSIVKFSSWSVKKIQLNGYWRNNGTDTWTDLSPYGNDGTVNGSPTTIQLQEVPYFKKDTFGLPMNKVRQKGLNFDGSGYVKVAHLSSLGNMSDGFTCMFWYRHAEDVSAGNYFWLVSKGIGHGAGVNNGLAISSYNNKVYAHINTDSGQFESVFTISAASPSSPVWWHVAVTYNGSDDMRLYINGAEEDDATVTGDITSTADAYPITIGGAEGSTSNLARGIIDEVKWYNRDLELKEIEKDFKVTKSKHSSTSAWSDDFSDGFI